MKYLPSIIGGLLGFMFVAFGIMFFLMMKGIITAPPPPPEGSWAALFMGAFVPSGYVYFVKVLEILGGVLVAIPRTRNIGLLVLGPIILNILAFHVFIMKGATLMDPILGFITIAALYLLWAGRKAFSGLIQRA
ncbi:MAG: hypothetical protein AAB263_20465 [Planctomycetota bacterium]